MPDTPRVTHYLAKSAEAWALAEDHENLETCGIFFWPTPGQAVPDFPSAFIELDNRHPDPGNHFKIDYEDFEIELLKTYGVVVAGQFALFHSHPSRTGQPSRDDVNAAEQLAKYMDGHPYWQPTGRHMIFSLWDLSWWWYDLEAFGRIGWKWPDD